MGINHLYPFMARMEVMGLDCGGSLIHPKFVLSSKHCFVNFSENCFVNGSPTGNCAAILGDHSADYNDVGEQRVTITKVHTAKMTGSDLAIAELERPVELSKTIGLIKVSSRKLKRGDVVTTAGWGIVGYNKQTQMHMGLADILRHTNLTVSQGGEGEQVTTYVNYTGPIPIDTCSGDSGGGLFSKNKAGDWEVHGSLYGGGYDCRLDILRGGGGRWNSVLPHLDWLLHPVVNYYFNKLDSETKVLFTF